MVTASQWWCLLLVAHQVGQAVALTPQPTRRVGLAARLSPPGSIAGTGAGEGGEPSIDGRVILVTGANGQFGSKVVRALLRGDSKCKVRAVVRSASDLASYGRLSYETGAEDGQGTISAPWVSREISFEATPEMRSYGLSRLEIVEGDLLDQGFMRRVTFGVDAVVFCAASPALRPFQIDPVNLLRDLVYKRQGRVAAGETVEERGVELTLQYLTQEMQRRTPDRVQGAPTSFVLLSSAATTGDAPMGGIGALGGARVDAQRSGESLLRAARSLPSYSIVRMGKLNDWQPEGAPLEYATIDSPDAAMTVDGADVGSITATDGAGFLVDALTNQKLRNRTVRVCASRGVDRV